MLPSSRSRIERFLDRSLFFSFVHSLVWTTLTMTARAYSISNVESKRAQLSSLLLVAAERCAGRLIPSKLNLKGYQSSFKVYLE